MDIKQAINTPVLINKVIGTNTVSKSSSGHIDNQTITISSDTSLCIDNSPISINNIEISYSNMGLLTQPPISISSQVNKLKSYNNTLSSSLNFSIKPLIYSNIELNSLYEKLASGINDSLSSKDYISKETYMLLSVQTLSNLIKSICETYLNDDQLKNHDKNTTNFTIIITKLLNGLLYLSNGIILLNPLIGGQELTSNYWTKLYNELSSSLQYLDYSFNNLCENIHIKTNEKEINEIYSCIKQLQNDLTIYSSFEMLISTYINHMYRIINCIDNIVNKVLLLQSQLSLMPYSELINSLDNILKLMKCVLSLISEAHSDTEKNYNSIINTLKSSVHYAQLISFSSNSPNLYTSLNSVVLMPKTYSNNLTNKNVYTNTKKTSVNDSDTTQILTITWPFYVYNLYITINGNIGTESFTGHISYDGLHNLNFFSIDDIVLNTEISISKDINKINILHTLMPQLEVSDIVPLNNYSSSSSTFNANISLSFTVNGEITAYALVPLIISK